MSAASPDAILALILDLTFLSASFLLLFSLHSRKTARRGEPRPHLEATR